MTDQPRRLPLSQQQRERVIADRAAPGSNRGGTQWVKPLAVKQPTLQGSAFGGVTVTLHGDDGTVARADAALVMWVGAANPTHAEPYDFWYPVTL